LHERDVELGEKQESLEKDRLIAAQQERIEELTQALDSFRAEVEETTDLRRQLAVARSRPGKVLRELLRYRVLGYLSTKSPPFSARSAAALARSAQKRDPKRSLGTALDSNAPEALLPTRRRPAAIIDPRKKTILVVSHEASRTGAPVLGLNIIQQLSTRYNVISLILGGGDLTDHFRKASASLYEADRIHMTDRELNGVIRDIAAHHPLMFAIVNSIESRMALRALKAAGVPTISLIHEFSSYARPRSAFPDVLTLSTDTVFSTRMTLENAVEDFRLYPGASIHVAPQGKCIVPATPGTASEALIEKLWLRRNLRPEAGNRKFLVIGLGSVELRKGVDLFIECATIVKNQPGGDRFQFVWIGNGFDPEREVAYSAYLADQMKRAGLGPQMKILRATSEIELAYQSADLLLLSSRLDPLPNVAIDALMLGLPVLCFEKTTGIADFLSENGLGEPCVAQYLDTHDLAQKVAALADSEDLRASVSERSRAAAGSVFDMNAYVSKIEAIAVQAVGAEARVKEEVKAILASGKFRGDFFKPPEMESSPEEKLVEDYVRRMATGFGVRKPMPGFQPTVYSWLHSREGKTNGDPFADFLRKGLPDGPWLQSVIQGGAWKIAPHAGLRAAIHLHVFYPDQLAGIAERLKLNASAPDLFISVTSDDAAARTREGLSGYRGRIVDVQVTPNLGRDIGPLLTQFGRALSASYDVIGHLHTKKSVLLENPSFAEARSTFLLENLVGGKRGGPMLDLILASMASDPAIGIVFPDDPHVLSWIGNRNHAEALAARMKCSELPEQFNFPIGAMFWTRSAVLKRFVELELAWGDYEPEPLPVDGMMVHVIERLFGVVPGVMRMTCALTNVRGLTR
jgi:glycosyltransferase involved in cell wall biosynthesis